MTHPDWCARKHGPAWPVHQAQIGADLQLSADLAYAVYVQQVDGAPAEVNLVRHDSSRTSSTTITRLTPLEAGILRDLLTEGLDLLGVQVGR